RPHRNPVAGQSRRASPPGVHALPGRARTLGAAAVRYLRRRPAAVPVLPDDQGRWLAGAGPSVHGRRADPGGAVRAGVLAHRTATRRRYLSLLAQPDVRRLLPVLRGHRAGHRVMAVPGSPVCVRDRAVLADPRRGTLVPGHIRRVLPALCTAGPPLRRAPDGSGLTLGAYDVAARRTLVCWGFALRETRL